MLPQNSFTKMAFRKGMIRPFKMCSSVLCIVLTVVQLSPHPFDNVFITPKRKPVPVTPIAPTPPALGNHPSLPSLDVSVLDVSIKRIAQHGALRDWPRPLRACLRGSSTLQQRGHSLLLGTVVLGCLARTHRRCSQEPKAGRAGSSALGLSGLPGEARLQST